MPHQCTACGHAFADGSKEMLGGCPDCGGNKFQFFPEGTEVPDEPPGDAGSDAPDRQSDESSVASTVGRATTRVRDFVSADPASADPSRPEGAEGGAGDPPVDAPDSASAGAGGAGPGATADATRDADATPDAKVTPDTDATPETDTTPDADAPWPDSSDAADPIRKGGFEASTTTDRTDGPFDSDDADEPDGIIDADARATREALDDAEDLAQSAARSGVASESEVAAATDASGGDATDAAGIDATDQEPIEDGDLAAAEATVDRADDAGSLDDDPIPGDDLAPGDETSQGRVVSEPTGEEPGVAELREQLNDQFESIKIIEPGQYELNLMELYDREEYIIALQENGRYVIQVPEQWMGDRDDR